MLPFLLISSVHPWSLVIPSNNNLMRVLLRISYPSAQLGDLIKDEGREERGRKSIHLAFSPLLGKIKETQGAS